MNRSAFGRVVLLICCCLAMTAQGFAQVGPPPEKQKEIEMLISQLGSPDEKVRQAAQEKLLGMGDDAIKALEAHVRGKAAAEAALEKIDANTIAGPTLVSLKFTDADVRTVFDELAKKSGYEIAPFNENFFQHANLNKVTVDIDRQAFWSAFREISAKAGVSLQNTGYGGNDRRILYMPGGGGGNAMKCPASINGAFMVVATSISRSNYVDLANPQNINRGLNLQLQVYTEPKVRVIGYSYQPELEEAADDRGNSLLAGGRERFMGREMNNARGWIWNVNCALQYPTANPGQKITKLRGKLRFTVPTRTETVEVADVMKARDISRKTAGGRRFMLKEVRRVSDRNYQVSVVLYRDNMDQQKFFQLIQAPGVRLFDAQGREFNYNGVNRSGAGDQADAVLNFFARPRDDGGAGPGEPAKLTWEVSAGTQELVIPFEFADLPLP
jgi:hypothetical protein